MLYALLNPKHRTRGDLPATGTSSRSTSPLNSMPHLWLEAVSLWNNALLISLSRVHNERKVSSKTRGQKSCLLPIPWGILSTFCHACALFSVKMTRFSSQKLPVRQLWRGLGRTLWCDIATRQRAPLFAEPGGKSPTLLTATDLAIRKLKCHVSM